MVSEREGRGGLRPMGTPVGVSGPLSNLEVVSRSPLSALGEVRGAWAPGDLV